MTGTSDNGREDGARGIVSGETGFAHTGAIVHDQCSYFVVTHDVRYWGWGLVWNANKMNIKYTSQFL